MSENIKLDSDDSERLAILEVKYDLLCEKLEKYYSILTENHADIKTSLELIEKQTARWESVGSGILITIGFIWAIFSGFITDVIHGVLNNKG